MSNILLQDPAFNDLDIRFLLERGFTIIDANLDALQGIPSSTFVFLPRAVYSVIWRTVVAVEPSLFFSSDMGKMMKKHGPDLDPLYFKMSPFIGKREKKELPFSKIVHFWEEHVIYFQPRSRLRRALRPLLDTGRSLLC